MNVARTNAVSKPMRLTLAVLTVPLLLSAAYAAESDPFAEGVRTTEPLTPEQQQKTFQLPPGFEIELVTAEPKIRKPMNMAFDAQGRLWVTESREYPFPAPLDKPARDTIQVLEDTDGDGRYDKQTTFAEGLNIPIGIYPYKNGVIAWSIPYITYFEDTDGDLKADKRTNLFGPLGWERDTHGNNASFRRGFDGWLYATHGFNNNSTFTAKDGSTITLNSGNTYRFRMDGSRIEQHTWGQVNPFGLAFDPLGNLYSADCHSAPIYQLLRGGYYPSFGKPDDGLGFAPTMLEHAHGSTAICGLVHYTDDTWPTEFRDNILIGNVMTSRINRDTLIERGSTRIAREEKDFITTTDPWFRPVDIQLGPDGAFYIADFYNRIIGHYEVPLLHPGRDRERGRLWKLTYKGQNAKAPLRSLAMPTKVPDLIKELGNPNITRRNLAMNQLVDTTGQSAVSPLKKALRDDPSWLQKVHGMWVLQRLNALDEKTMKDFATDEDRGVRTHAQRMISEVPTLTPTYQQLALKGLQDRDANVQRAAAEALAQHPAFEHVRPLLALRLNADPADNHLVHMARMSLRDQLRPAGVLGRVSTLPLNETEARAIADVCVALATPDAAAYLVRHLQKYPENRDTLNRYLRHAARYLPESRSDELAELARGKVADDFDLQLSLFQSVQQGLAQRGAQPGSGVRTWGAELAERLLTSIGNDSWQNTPMEGAGNQANPWVLQVRPSTNGNKDAQFLSSLPIGGEQLTGTLRSMPFKLPAKFSFYLAGHAGYTDNPAHKKNYVHLRLVEGGTVVAEAAPPRNDTAHPIEWDLSAHAGKQGYLEVTDGDTGDAYAWLAVGRFEPALIAVPPVPPNQLSQRQRIAADLVRTLGLKNLLPQLQSLLKNMNTDLDVRAAAANAVQTLQPNPAMRAPVAFINDTQAPSAWRQQVADALFTQGDNTATALKEILKTAPQRVQTRLVLSQLNSGDNAADVLGVFERGEVPARVLLDRSLKDKLLAANSDDVKARYEKLTKGQTPVSEELQKLIDERRTAYAKANALVSEGAKVYTQNCGVCHQVGGQGGLVGPQLDGIGNRGIERICEDILDPNRNVDHAFRSHLIVLKDGDIVSGLPRREEGEMLILAEATGKEISVPKNNIEERRESEVSLMPDNFGEVISANDFYNLLAYLLAQNGKANK